MLLIGVARGDGVADGYLLIIDVCEVPFGTSLSSAELFGQWRFSCFLLPLAEASVTPQSFLKT